jgi:hypothetical protein
MRPVAFATVMLAVIGTFVIIGYFVQTRQSSQSPSIASGSLISMKVNAISGNPIWVCERASGVTDSFADTYWFVTGVQGHTDCWFTVPEMNGSVIVTYLAGTPP